MSPRSFRWILKLIIISITLFSIYLIYSKTFSHTYEHEFEEEPESLKTSPFVNGQPKLMIVLAYQRSGSSFIGEWFNTNPDVFFSFEPVDSLYSAMYGTSQNHNVPSDITNYPNGTLRQLPAEEIAAVSIFLRHLLLCELDNIPTQSLFNFYSVVTYNHFSAMPYTNCLREKMGFLLRKCEPYLTSFCGKRFGEVPLERQGECFRRLWTNQYNQTLHYADNISQNFINYQLCVAYLRKVLQERCENLLLESCQNHSIRVIKTVRVTMESMEPLLEMLPNFRVIHLIRDPRAVTLSRRLHNGYVLGIYSGNDNETIIKEAKLYCNTVVQDIKVRQELEKKYPGRIYPLIFEKLVTDTPLHLNNVYRFLDATPHESTLKWLSTSTIITTGRKSSEQMANWQNVLTFRMNREIVEHCTEFYRLAKYK